MNPLVITNLWSAREVEGVKAHDARFNPDFRIVTPLELDFGTVWKVADSNKHSVEWTKRFLRRFLDESFDTLVKIDPDTQIQNSLPEMPQDCDVAGDFRKSQFGWLWLGACQYFTRYAVEKILADPLYNGGCRYQDVALAASVARTGLRAFNMAEIDGWSLPDSSALVTHPSRGHALIQKTDFGPVSF